MAPTRQLTTDVVQQAMIELALRIESKQAQLCDLVPQLTSLQTELERTSNSSPHQDVEELKAQYLAVVRVYEQRYHEYLSSLQQLQQIKTYAEEHKIQPSATG